MWCLFGYYWWVVAQRRINPATIDALAILGVLAVAGLALTVAWVAHNLRLARRLGRRKGFAGPPETFETDHLQRPLVSPGLETLRVRPHRHRQPGRPAAQGLPPGRRGGRLMDLLSFIVRVQHHGFYLALLVFFAWYPMASSLMWIYTAAIFFRRREQLRPEKLASFYALPEHPLVSFIIPAFNEETNIAKTLRAVLAVDYPAFEVLVVDDCSTDRTLDQVLPFLEDARVRVVRKAVNEGKAMALNDTIPLSRGELVFVMDADAEPDPDILKYMVPHFQSPRCARGHRQPAGGEPRQLPGQAAGHRVRLHHLADAPGAAGVGPHHDHERRGGHLPARPPCWTWACTAPRWPPRTST